MFDFQVKTIDSTAGKLFDVRAVDLDADEGRNFELLVTNHQGNKDSPRGAVYYYKLIGSSFRTGNWSRVTINDNFPVTKSGVQQAAPGTARALYPLAKKNGNDDKNVDADQTTTRPYLLVAGDGAEQLYLFEPSDVGTVLSYKLAWSQDFNDTVGGISIADINGDGVNEFVVAIYEKGLCYVFTLVPS